MKRTTPHIVLLPAMLLTGLILGMQSLAGVLTVQLGQQIQPAINAVSAQGGGTVNVVAGTFPGNFTSRSNVFVVGTKGVSTPGVPRVPRFIVPFTKINGSVNGSNTVNAGVVDCDIESTAGRALLIDNVTNFTFQRNSVYAGGGHTIQGSNIRQSKVMDNYIHHSKGDRAMEIWNASDTSFSRNILYELHNGIHILASGDNIHCDYNVGNRIEFKLLEVQNLWGDKTPRKNATCIGNIFINPKLPNVETYMYSWPENFRNGLIFKDNFCDNAFVGPWGANPWGKPEIRFGYAFEVGGFPKTTVFEGNTAIGPNKYFQNVVTPSYLHVADSNSFYGPAPHIGDFSNEGGDLGSSSITVGNPTINRDNSKAPAPPAWLMGGIIPGQEGGGGGTTDPPPPTFTITAPASPVDPNTVVLTFKNQPATMNVQFKTTGGNENIGTFVPSTGTSVTYQGLPLGWGIYADVNGVRSAAFTTAGTPPTGYPAGKSFQPKIKGSTTQPTDPEATTTEHELPFDVSVKWEVDGKIFEQKVQIKRWVKVTAKGDRTVAPK